MRPGEFLTRFLHEKELKTGSTFLEDVTLNETLRGIYMSLSRPQFFRSQEQAANGLGLVTMVPYAMGMYQLTQAGCGTIEGNNVVFSAAEGVQVTLPRHVYPVSQGRKHLFIPPLTICDSSGRVYRWQIPEQQPGGIQYRFFETQGTDTPIRRYYAARTGAFGVVSSKGNEKIIRILR